MIFRAMPVLGVQSKSMTASAAKVAGALLATSLLLAPVVANAFTLDFEDGGCCGDVGPYSVAGFDVSIRDAHFIDSFPLTSSGRVAIAPYSGTPTTPYAYRDILVEFSSAASFVSVWALSPQGAVPATMYALGQTGEVLGSSSFQGQASDQNGVHPYKAPLSVSVDGIYGIRLTGQLWVGGTNGWSALYDDLTVSPSPIPEATTTTQVMGGLVRVTIFTSRWRLRRTIRGYAALRPVRP